MGMEQSGDSADDIIRRIEEIRVLKDEIRRAHLESLSDFPEFAEVTRIRIEEDADEIAEAVYEAREGAKKMSTRDLEVEIWKLQRVVLEYEEALALKRKPK